VRLQFNNHHLLGSERETMHLPKFLSTSATSSLLTSPSLSRSRTWNASRISRATLGGSFAAASVPAPPVPLERIPITGDECPGERAPLVGEGGSSLVNLGCGMGSVLGDTESSSAAVYDWLSLLGDTIGVWPLLLGELPGVPGRAEGGEFGVEGRRKGDARGDPKDSGDGLNAGLLDCIIVSDQHSQVSIVISYRTIVWGLRSKSLIT